MLLINIFTEDFFEDINNDAESWFDTSNYNKNDKRPLQTGIDKKAIGMFKDELGGKIMKECKNVYMHNTDKSFNDKSR